MVRWYSHGDDCINRGLPHYIAIDRNPENSLEVQNSACNECGIMMRLKPLKGGSDHDNVENGVTHGTAVLMDLILPWVNTHKVVCADSYFALVTAAELLYVNGLKFMAVIKTATRKYPMAHLSSQELEKRGDSYGMVKRNTSPYGCELSAYIFMDQDRRYFISSVSSMDAGFNTERIRSRQMQIPWMLPLQSCKQRHQRSTMVPALRSTDTKDSDRNPWTLRRSYRHMNGIKGKT